MPLYSAPEHLRLASFGGNRKVVALTACAVLTARGPDEALGDVRQRAGLRVATAKANGHA